MIDHTLTSNILLSYHNSLYSHYRSLTLAGRGRAATKIHYRSLRSLGEAAPQQRFTTARSARWARPQGPQPRRGCFARRKAELDRSRSDLLFRA